MTDYFLDYNGQVSQAGTLVDTGTTTLTNLHLTGTLLVDGATSLAAATSTTLAAGLTGSVSANRYVGATASVAPTTGAHLVGDWCTTLTGRNFLCTVAATPGTWVEVGSVTFAPLASPTFTGTVTVPNGVAATDAAAFGQVPSIAGLAKVKGPYPFAFNTASLNNGVALFTPTIGDWILDIWVEITTAFDGTTPFVDFGTFSGGNNGLLKSLGANAFDASAADTAISSNAGLNRSGGLAASLSSTCVAEFGIGGARWETPVTAANPLLVVVSQNGQKGGAAVGGAAGAGNVYVMVATPTTA